MAMVICFLARMLSSAVWAWAAPRLAQIRTGDRTRLRRDRRCMVRVSGVLWLNTRRRAHALILCIHGGPGLVYRQFSKSRATRVTAYARPSSQTQAHEAGLGAKAGQLVGQRRAEAGRDRQAPCLPQP